MVSLTDDEVEAVVAKVGPPRANGAKIRLDVDRIRAMRAAGFSWAQIGAYFDVSHMTVRRRLWEAEGRVDEAQERWKEVRSQKRQRRFPLVH